MLDFIYFIGVIESFIKRLKTHMIIEINILLQISKNKVLSLLASKFEIFEKK